MRRRIVTLVVSFVAICAVIAAWTVWHPQPNRSTASPSTSASASAPDGSPDAPRPILQATPTPEPFTPPARSAPIVPPPRYSPASVESVPFGPRAPLIYRVATKQPVVFITIDDGWTRDPRVVTLIQKTHLPVSLFLVESPATTGERYFRSLEAAGARIEDHTKDHPDLTKLSYAAQRAEICAPIEPYASMFGRTPTLFRPPYGRWNQLTLRAAADCGVGAAVLWDAVMSGGKFATIGGLKGGDIILLHFRPTLYTDLVDLMSIIRAHHLGVGLLEDYLKPVAVKPPPTQSPSASPTPTHSPTPSPTPSPSASVSPTVSTSPKPTPSV